MSLEQASLSSVASYAVASPDLSFAEPDWKGDDDFGDLSAAIDLDGWLSDLEAAIGQGARLGWLTSYQARRASFDLQSIRCQIKFHRDRLNAEAPDAVLRAVLSRADRLRRFLTAARTPA